MNDLADLFGSETESSEEETLIRSLPPEIEEGNIEYKLKLLSPSPYRFEHLVTQMKWRLKEGLGEAIYEIGVEDCGHMTGLRQEEMEASLETLTKMAERLGASISLMRQVELDGRFAAEVLVRLVAENQHNLDVRVAVLGNAAAGKSTLLGVLSQGELDDGQGKARLNLFRHVHEVQTGRTSSISQELVGFDGQGQLINYATMKSAAEISEYSSKLVTFIDLAGHQKYTKTTIFGLTTYEPLYAMLVISAKCGLAGTTKEHLGFALALEVPVFVVLSKVDACSEETIAETLSLTESILKLPGCRKVPFTAVNKDDVITAATNMIKDNVCPIFMTSSVTGHGLDLLILFLNLLPPNISMKDREQLDQERPEFKIEEIYSLSDVGTVVGGTLQCGVIKPGDRLVVGPFGRGEFQPVTVVSIRRFGTPSQSLKTGQSASLALSDAPKLRKGMVLVTADNQPSACFRFDADIEILYHACAISKGFQTTVHIGNVCQTAVIESMDQECLYTNDSAHVTFRFLNRPECIRPDARFLFRESSTKGLGHVTAVHPLPLQ